MLSKIIERAIALYSRAIIVCTHFYGDVILIIEKKSVLLTLKKIGVLHVLLNK